MSTVRVDLGERYTGVRNGILLVMSTGTRAMVRIEEQMALLMQKLDEVSADKMPSRKAVYPVGRNV